MNRLQKALIKAYEDGYRVRNGIAYKPNGEVLQGTPDRNGYISIKPNHDTPVFIHRLLSYQKWGNKIFDPTLECRHLDGNKQNNLNDNIALGDHSRNMMNIPPEVRMEKSIKAATKKRRFTDDEMIQIRKDHELFQSYDKVMEKWDISSKGTLHYMLHKKYVTKVK